MKNLYKIFFATIFISVMLSSCGKDKKETTKAENNDIFGLATPIKLNYDTTRVILSDYFGDVSKIKEIIYPQGLKPLKNNIQDTITLIASSDLKPISVMKFKTEHTFYDIPVFKSAKQKFTYTFNDKKHKYKKVALLGDMNAWNPGNTPLKYKDGKWFTDLFLVPDKYSYQLELDGKRYLDEFNPVKVSNGMGGFNSQLNLANSGDKKLLLSSYQFDNDTISLLTNIKSVSVLAMFQNQSIDCVVKDKSIKFAIPASAKDTKRTYIRVWAFNKSKKSNEVFIPLDNGKVITQKDQLNRQDKETNILYFLMVDRFYNKNKNNDAPLNDPEVSPKADYHGGDLAGVSEIINKKYFEKLGATAIWLSPIVKNPEGKFGFYNKKGIKSKFSGYHGYWPISFTKTDERFGTSEDLKNLVENAHRNNMNVYLDFVANHVHENHPVYQANKDRNWATNLYLPDGSLNTEKWDEHRLTTWFDVFLPTLNLENTEVANMLSDSAIYWLEEYDVDGFRHDATKHIPLSFWRTLSKKVKKLSGKTGKKYYQVGETYGTPQLISSYISSGLLDGQFDFNIYDALIQSIVNDKIGFSLFEQKMNQSLEYYGSHNLMGYMTGNQDKTRFMALATNDVSLDEDSKYAGWSRKITKKNKVGYDKLAIMHAFNMTIPGIPVIYYGDEIGLTGGNDPDNRRNMKFENLNEAEQALFDKIAKLAHLRRENPVFLFGDFRFDDVKEKTIMFSRHYFNKTAIVCINNSDKTQKFDIPKDYLSEKTTLNTVFGNKVSNRDIRLEPYSFEVILLVN